MNKLLYLQIYLRSVSAIWYQSLRCIPYYRYDRYNWAWYYRPLVRLHHLFQGSMKRHLIKLKNKKRKVVIFFKKRVSRLLIKKPTKFKKQTQFHFYFSHIWYNWALYYVSLEKNIHVWKVLFYYPFVYILVKSSFQ